MSMLSGNQTLKAEINLAPMIDVLLVLLVIFMVVQAPTPTGLAAQVPQLSDSASPEPPVPRDVVITVRENSIQVNQETIAPESLPSHFARIFQLRPNGVVFIRAQKDLPFGAVAAIIDQAKGAGISKIALLGAI